MSMFLRGEVTKRVEIDVVKIRETAEYKQNGRFCQAHNESSYAQEPNSSFVLRMKKESAA
jgi:Zn-finger nucleic acid-binding protein